MHSLSHIRILDALLFAGLMVLGQWLSIHGKAVSSYLFNGHDSLTRPGPNPIAINAVVLLAAGLFAAIRYVDWSGRRKVLTAVFMCVMSPIAVIGNDTPSSLVFFLHLLFLALVTGVVWAETLMDGVHEARYWELLFEYAVKAAQLLIGVFTALAAVLQVISNINKEASMGFITTLAYPTMVIGLALFFFFYWVMEPTWQRIGEHYRKSSRRNGARMRPLKPRKR